MSPTRGIISRPLRGAPIPLDDLERRVAALWAVEPQVPQAERSELLAELAQLETDLDAIRIRRVAGAEVRPTEIRRCGLRYLSLRRHWSDTEAAA